MSDDITANAPVLLEVEGGTIEIRALPEKTVSDLPQDAELTSPTIVDYAQYLSYLLSNFPVFKEEVRQRLSSMRPDECAVEFAIALKGESNLPYIVKGEVSSSIKVSAKWLKKKKEEDEGW